MIDAAVSARVAAAAIVLQAGSSAAACDNLNAHVLTPQMPHQLLLQSVSVSAHTRRRRKVMQQLLLQCRCINNANTQLAADHRHSPATNTKLHKSAFATERIHCK
jgi:hypothetical protein